jgi:Putative Ig domain
LGSSDPELNTTLSYKAIGLPTGASLDSNTGEFKWTPNAAQVGVHNVSFTVTDSNLDEWRLEIATLGTESYRQLNGGSVSVNGLVDLDPGTLTNGFYQLRLTAVDISGRQSVTTSVVEINSGSKSGYQSQATDLVTSLAGVEVKLQRFYPKLQVGDNYQLQVIGDFADQKGVALIRDYVQYGVNTASVSVDNLGLITAIDEGVGIISASRNGISAVTATRVGTFKPVTDADVLIAKAEKYGLDVYPGAVTLK